MPRKFVPMVPAKGKGQQATNGTAASAATAPTAPTVTQPTVTSTNG
jgi:hypothetical protein